MPVVADVTVATVARGSNFPAPRQQSGEPRRFAAFFVQPGGDRASLELVQQSQEAVAGDAVVEGDGPDGLSEGADQVLLAAQDVIPAQADVEPALQETL